MIDPKENAADLTAVSGEDDQLPSTFGRYEVIRFLGSGGFGAVYEGIDTQLQRRVAIKVPLQKRKSTFNAQQYQAEAQNLAKLRHPGIVSIYDIGVDPSGNDSGGFYLVTEFLEGESLFHRLRQKRFHWTEAVDTIAQLAEALAHAHAQRVVHRDIKPANILIVKDRGPVLVDFGLAIAEQNAGDQIGSVRGTLTYMAPEQAEGRGHRIDGRTDIYALGVVLYELIAGSPPFRSEIRVELSRQIVNDAPQPLRQLVPEVPKALEKVCLRALAKSISRRYTTAADFAEQLRKLITKSIIVESNELGIPVSEDQVSESQGHSGQSFSDSVDNIVAGKRLVTVLHITSNVLSHQPDESLDPEDQIEAVRRVNRTCTRTVKNFGGNTLPGNGQEITVCFGYPVSYEDAARRAVDAATTLRDSLHELATELKKSVGATLQVWFSIHSGTVVTSESDQSIVGDALKLVTKIERESEPDQIVITADCYQLLRRVVTAEKLPTSCHLPGQPSVELYQVTEIQQRGDAVQSEDDVQFTPLVGRDQEVNMLIDRWELASEGLGQMVALIGEAGLGKSRLVNTLKEHVSCSTSSPSGSIIEWTCSPYHTNSMFRPVIESLQHLAGLDRQQSDQTNRQSLRRYLSKLNFDLRTAMPIACNLLSIPCDPEFPVLAISSPKQKEMTLQFLVNWIAGEANREPLLFIVEDLHWIDPSTLDFLAQLADSPISENVLCVITFRPEFSTPWTSRAHQTQIALNRLTRSQVHQIVREKVPSLPSGVIDRIVQRTDGVPLFVEEYAMMLAESSSETVSDTITTKPDSTAGSRSGEFSVPASLQGLLMTRLDRVDGDSNVVRLAATIGREFSSKLIMAVCELDPEHLQNELEKLVRSQLLYRRRSGDETSYLFKHALIQDAAYDSMLRGQRRDFHFRIARVMESQFLEIEAEHPELLAHHYTEACQYGRAVPLWEKAGARATQRGAFVEAIEHLQKGMAALEQLPGSSERDLMEYKINVPLGIATHSLSGYATPELGQIYDRRTELCQQLDDELGQLHALWAMGSWRIVRDEVQITLGIADRMMSMAEKMDDGCRMEALFIQAIAQFYHGEFQGSLDSCQQGWALYQPERCLFHAGRLGQHAGVAHLCYMALCHWHLGQPSSARQRMKEAIELAESLNHPFSVAFSMHHASWLSAEMGRGDEAIQYANRLIEVSREQAFFFWETTGMLHRAGGHNCNGNWKSASQDLEQGLMRYAATGAELALPRYHAYHARCLLHQGKLDATAQALDHAMTAAEKMDERFYQPEVVRLQAALEARRKREQSAKQRLVEGIELAKKQKALIWEWKLLSDLNLIEESFDTTRRLEEIRGLIEPAEFDVPSIDTAEQDG